MIELKSTVAQQQKAMELLDESAVIAIQATKKRLLSKMI
jgi:hypothetical protein